MNPQQPEQDAVTIPVNVNPAQPAQPAVPQVQEAMTALGPRDYKDPNGGTISPEELGQVGETIATISMVFLVELLVKQI